MEVMSLMMLATTSYVLGSSGFSWPDPGSAASLLPQSLASGSQNLPAQETASGYAPAHDAVWPETMATD